MSKSIRILGIDPGLRHTGWGVIDMVGPKLSYVGHGVISPDPKMALGDRLAAIFQNVKELGERFLPTAAGVEETLVNANPRQALLLGQARGAAMTALALNGLSIGEFAPRKIKLSVVGSGAAEKEQVAFMVQRLLPRAGKVSSDAADALACAICVAHHYEHAKRAKAVS